MPNSIFLFIFSLKNTYGSEFQKGESYGGGGRERISKGRELRGGGGGEREREGGGEGGREMISNFAASTERFCSVNRAILKRQQREHKEFISAQARREE